MKKAIAWYVFGFLIGMVLFSAMPMTKASDQLVLLNYLSLSVVFFVGMLFSKAQKSKSWWTAVMAVILFTLACLMSGIQE